MLSVRIIIHNIDMLHRCRCGMLFVYSIGRMEGGRVTGPWQSDLGTQSLHQYFDLLKTNIKQYENLKKSGAPDMILKDLIDQQSLLLSKVCEELTKS
jgi:hypothetical protein